MVWQPEIDRKTVELAKKMGGQEGIDVQHGRGKLTIREARFVCDQSSFQEIGRLAGAKYDGEELSDFRPSNTVIGLCELNGRKVVVNGGTTVRVALLTRRSVTGRVRRPARDWRLPYVRLLDATGGVLKHSSRSVELTTN